MPPLNDNPDYRIDSLESIAQAAARLVDWFRTAQPRAASILAAVPREQLAAELLGFALGEVSASSLEQALITLSTSPVQESNVTPRTGGWADNPFHCFDCAGKYQKLLNEVIDLAISTKADDSLTNELATHDHLLLARFIARKRLTWPFRFDSIFYCLAKNNTSTAGTIIRDLLADAKLHKERQFELQREDLIRRVEATLSNLAQHIDEMSPEQLQSALVEIFIKRRDEICSYLSWKNLSDNEASTDDVTMLLFIGPELAGNVFEQLQTLCPPAHRIFPAALRLVNSTKNWSLISTLLTILRQDSLACPDLMAAALAQKKKGTVLELINHGVPPQAGPESPPPEHHLERLRKHAEYNEARRLYLLQLDAMSPQERLRHIAHDDQWPVAALPTIYADVDAALSLPEALRDCLKARLLNAPRGAWTKFRTELSKNDARRD